jgi:MSHA type pilus biogenesis protein MshL
VVIDAQVLEVSLSDGFDLGVDWNFVQSRVNVQGERQSDYGFGFGAEDGLGSRGASGDQSPTAIVIGNPEVTALNTVDTIFQATVNVLQTFGGVKVVSNPHVRARHGMPALVTSGTTKSYIKEITRETDENNNVSISTNTATAFEGVMLGVMPFINDDGSVDLDIFPITSQVNLENTQTFADGTTLTLPVVDVRNVTTNVRANDGDTIILGGLIYKAGNKADRSVPGAENLPGLGWLFNNRTDSETVRELVIIMRIRVV